MNSDWKRRSGYSPGAHYSTFSTTSKEGLTLLRQLFPDGKADEMNFALFSTSGVHGTYATIEQIEGGLSKYGESPEFLRDESGLEVPDDWRGDDLTFVVVQPRICCLRWGNLKCSLADMDYLKGLRSSSWDAIQGIGK